MRIYQTPNSNRITDAKLAVINYFKTFILQQDNFLLLLFKLTITQPFYKENHKKTDYQPLRPCIGSPGNLNSLLYKTEKEESIITGSRKGRNPRMYRVYNNINQDKQNDKEINKTAKIDNNSNYNRNSVDKNESKSNMM